MKKDNLEIILEDINGKFDLVLEGHTVLNKSIDDLDHKLDNRFDLLSFKMQAGHESLNAKIDAVAVNLAAHRRDTEAHPALYKVKEGN